MTWIVQWHAWRRLKAQRDILDCTFVCGFFTLLVSRRPLLDNILKMLAAHRAMLAEDDDYAGC